MNNKRLIIKDLFSSNEIRFFCNKYRLNEDAIIENIGPLSQYKEVLDACSDCKGKNGCYSPLTNMTAKLLFEQGKVRIEYEECELAKAANPDNFEVLFCSFNDGKIIINEKRSKVFTLMQKFIEGYDKNKLNKGFYMYGSYGTGKSFLAYKFAEQLTQKGLKVTFLYYPDFVRKVKSNIGSMEMERLINKAKQTEVLFIDDLGAENNTAFVRDDILSPILQHRMNNDLSTFITSNCSLEELVQHFSETNYEIDKNKAGRIIDRISYLTIPVKLEDKNYRNDI